MVMVLCKISCWASTDGNTSQKQPSQSFSIETGLLHQLSLSWASIMRECKNHFSWTFDEANQWLITDQLSIREHPCLAKNWGEFDLILKSNWTFSTLRADSGFRRVYLYVQMYKKKIDISYMATSRFLKGPNKKSLALISDHPLRLAP